MATIVTRAGKGAALTHQEVDANFSGLNTELGQKEVASNKGVANGYASLDAAGKVPSAQLPSYVDDVVEVANFASLPGTGETGKIYVTIDANKTYRWTGSAYIEISASPGSTDSLAEGSTNLYFSQARARASVSASGSLSYNSTTGVFSFSDAVTSVAGRTGAVTLTSSDVGLGNVENKSSATIRGEITSSNVTTALGYTPYNSSNPSGYISGNQTITVSGDASGSGATSIALTLANSGVSVGTYTKVTVDAKGRVTTGASLASGDLPTYTGTITSSQITTGLGYTPFSNAGGTVSGAISSSLAPAAINITTPGTTLYGFNFAGASSADNAQGITWSWSAGSAQAGIYVQSSGAYGTKMYFATTDSFATGAKTAIAIDHVGNTNIVRGALTQSGNQVLHAGNYNSYALPLSGGALTGSLTIGTDGGGANFVQRAVNGWQDVLNVWRGGSNVWSLQDSSGSAKVTSGSFFIGSNLALHAGNYNSYSPTLTGTGASGTWGINVTGTAGSISGYNNPTTAATANTIVYRDSGGDIYGRYFFGVHFNQSSSNTENPSIAAFWTNSGADNYNRKSSPAHVISQLGLLTTSNYSSYALPLTGGSLSGRLFASFNGRTNYYTGSNIEVGTSDNTPPSISFHRAGYSATSLYENDGELWTNAWTSRAQNGKLLSSGNYSSYALPLSGGTITGTVTFNGANELRFADQNNTVRGFIASQTNAGSGAAGLTIATSGGEDIVFKDGNAQSGDVNLTIAGTRGALLAPGVLGSTSWAASTGNGTTRWLSPKGAAASWDGTQVGAIKIRLPFRANDSMWRMKVYIYNYSGNTMWEYHIGNYAYSAGGYNSAASCICTGNASPLTVRWGNDGSYDCVWIGETSSGWAYLQVVVAEFSVGFRSATSTANQDAWDISYVTSFGTVATSYTPAVNLASGSGVAGNAIIHAGNYNSYALPLSGGTLSGLLGTTNVVVGANGAGTSYEAASSGKLYFGTSASDSPSNYNISTSMEDFGGNYSKLDVRWYTGQRYYAHTGYGGVRYFEITNGAEMFSVGRGDGNVRVNNSLLIGGNTALHAANYSSYALPLSGGQLSGNLNVASNWLLYDDTSRDLGAAVYRPNSATRAVRFSFADASSTGTGGNFAGVMHFHPWDGTSSSTGDASYQLAFGSTAVNASGTPRLRIRNGIDTTWGTWYDVLTSANYTSYSPSLTGGGASGSWGISVTGSSASCTGNAATATTLATARTINGTSFNGSANITTSSWGTARTLTVGGTGKSVDGSAAVSWSLTEIGAPSTTGTGASGTWAISISGNAATVTNGLTTSNYSSYALPLTGGSMTGSVTASAYNTPSFIRFASDNNWAYGCSYDGGSQYWMQVQFYGSGDDNRGFRVLNSNGNSVAFRVNGLGNAIAAGNVTAYSDERVKANWRTLEDGFVVKLAGVKSGIYDRTDIDLTQAGVSAQSLRDVLPQAVIESDDGDLSVAYGNAALVSAVELAKELVALKHKITELEARIH